MADHSKKIEIHANDPRIVTWKLSGKLTKDEMADIMRRIEEIRKAGDKARLYLDITEYDGFELGAITEKLSHFDTIWHGIDRAAYIVGKKWMTNAMELIDKVTPMHIRAFSQDDADLARAWLVEND